MKTDLKFRLAIFIKNRFCKAYKAQNVMKTNKTFSLLGCCHYFLKSWFIRQLYGTMTLDKYGSVWQIDHSLPIASIILLVGKDMKKCFNLINLRPV